MKKQFKYLLILAGLLLSASAEAQLPNQNMYLLRALNQHPVSQGAAYSALWGYRAPDGREYAILGCDSGTAFVDITDSANIREVDFLKGPVSDWREMKTYSHYAYIVSEAQNSGIQIVDLQYLPDSIRFVKKFNATGHTTTHTISQSGPYLYLSGANSSFVQNGGIAILDLTVDPETPVLKGKWTTLYVHDCRVENDTIWAANIFDEEVSIIDARNKNSMTTIRTFQNLPGSGPHNTALSTNRKRLFVTDEIGSAPYRLKVWNVENPSNPVFVTSWQPTNITTSIVHNIETYGNYAIIAHYTAGVRVLNISNPDAPQEVAWYDTNPSNNSVSYYFCWGFYIFSSGKIIASDRQTGLYVLKTTFPLTDIGNNNSPSVPDGYSLEQNYPNPFNPSTKIKFSVAKNSEVSLNIYDLSGKLVAEVLNDRRDGGTYEVEFSAQKYGLSSGSYLYKLKAGDFVQTRKMTLVK